MRSPSFLPRLLALSAAIGCSSPVHPSVDTASIHGAWASDQATLTISDGTATLELLASGGCFGSYGQIHQPIPFGDFVVSGTYTQLIGAYPGTLQYAAQYSGQEDGADLRLTITVPALSLSIGPMDLTAGRRQDWPACQYP